MSNLTRFLGRLPGDKNFLATQDSLVFENNNGKKFSLLLTDIEECLRALWQSGEKVDEAFEGDWSYDEGKYRQGLGEAFKSLDGNTVSTTLGSQTPNTVRALEIYAGYLLNHLPESKLGTPELLKKESLDLLFSLKAKFRSWLEEHYSLSEKTVTEYPNTIGGKISKIAGADLFAIGNAKELTVLSTLIRSNDEYIGLNQRGGGMYEAALKKYEAFTEMEFENHESPSDSIICSPLTKSLLAKPFLILTGPSGTGKTRSAYREAKRTGGTKGCCLVAVGADWTDNRHVLGFLNPLETVTHPDNNKEQIPVYETTPVVDLILKANDRPDAPHFLILDEMNLSHVERYFADFLSAIELEDKTGALKLHSAETAATRTGTLIPQQLDFPENLFVIGTVNVDETTYMFSPKVLDRANVIEIRANETELDAFLKGEPGDEGSLEAIDYGVSFLDASVALRHGSPPDDCPALPDSIRQEAAGKLMQLFNLLKKGRFEFGFRTGNEVLNYLRTSYFLAGKDELSRQVWANEEWKQAFGEQVLQKILPKLHGSKSRLSPLLGALGTWCATGDEELAMKHFPDDGGTPKRSLKDTLNEEGREFEDAYNKIVEMIHVLNSDQFVSFIC